MRFPGRLRHAVVLLACLACVSRASAPDRLIFGGKVPTSVLLKDASSAPAALTLDGPLQSVPSPGDFFPMFVSAMFQSPEGVRLSGVIFLVLVFGATMKYLVSPRFHDVLSDVCSTLLAIEQDGR